MRRTAFTCVLLLSATTLPACSDTTEPQNMRPEAEFTYAPQPPIQAEPVTFTGTGTDPDGTVTAWDWDFGDGATASGEVVTHSYQTEGARTVILTVTDDRGESGSATEVVDVVRRISFGAAAGHWHGTVTREAGPQGRAYLVLEESTGQGGSAGTLVSWLGPRSKCTSALRASDGDGDSWTLERTGDGEACVASSATLTYTRNDERLRYTDSEMTGTLHRSDAISFDALVGTWWGEGSDGADDWTMKAVFSDSTVYQGNAAAVWELWEASLDPGTDQRSCGGEWLVVDGDDPEYSFRELSGVLEGQGNCIAGYTTITREGDNLTVEFVGDEGQWPATTTLSRTGPP